jgi:RimJ/RimL family protein N-acetyltransferase
MDAEQANRACCSNHILYVSSSSQMGMLALKTARLRLVAASAQLLRSELAGREAFGIELGATVPLSWPPPLYERQNIQWALDQLLREPSSQGWLTWFWVRNTEAKPLVLGLGGFKGKPGPSGVVEIGYNVLSDFQRQGFATEAVSALVEWALSHPEVAKVVAETLPQLPASVRVLRKCGFEFVGNGSDIEVLRFERKRANE